MSNLKKEWRLEFDRLVAEGKNPDCEIEHTEECERTALREEFENGHGVTPIEKYTAGEMHLLVREVIEHIEGCKACTFNVILYRLDTKKRDRILAISDAKVKDWLDRTGIGAILVEEVERRQHRLSEYCLQIEKDLGAEQLTPTMHNHLKNCARCLDVRARALLKKEQ